MDDIHMNDSADEVFRWSQLHKLSPTDPMFHIPILSLKKLNAYRDAEYLLRTTPDLKLFRLAHRTIKLWARERGLYSRRFGYFGGHHVTLMLSKVCKMLSREAGVASVADIVRAFFAYFAAFDFTTDMIFDQEFHHPKPRYHRSDREPMVILSIHSPVINVAYTTSPDTLRTMRRELKRADNLLSEDNITWPRLMGLRQVPDEIGPQSGGAIDFVQDFQTFVKVDIHYWGPSIAKGGRLVEWIETKCPSFITGKVTQKIQLPSQH